MFTVLGSFDYQVTATYHGNALDAQGFLLDNTYFARYFADFAGVQVGVSCEVLACTIAEQLLAELGTRACDCDAIEVTLWGVPGVSVSAVCRAARPVGHNLTLEDM